MGATMSKSREIDIPSDKDELVTELESLKKQVYKLQMEIDILNTAAEIIKKDPGIDLQKITNKEKTILIDALRMKYHLNELFATTGIAKSSYLYQKKALSQPDQIFCLTGKGKIHI